MFSDKIEQSKSCQKENDSLTQQDHEFRDIEVLLNEGKYDKTEEMLLLLAGRNQKRSVYYIKLGHLMYKLKQFLKATNYYKLSLEDASQDELPEIQFSLGQVYFHSDLIVESLGFFTVLYETNPSYKFINIAYLRMSLIFKKLKDYNNALFYATKIIKESSVSKQFLAEAICVAGNCFELQGKAKKSLGFYKNALKIHSNFRTVTCVAWGYLNENPNLTIKICQKYLTKTIPDYEINDINFLYSLAYYRIKNYRKACQKLEIIVRSNPNIRIYNEYLGIIYFAMNEHLKALEIFQKIHEEIPLDCDNLNNMALVYKSLGSLGDCLHILNSLVMFNTFSNPGEFIERFKKKENLNMKEPLVDILAFPLNQNCCKDENPMTS
ncbi:hypothetical protein SteCoe_24851 [Stentor coeruleus]|uniref:Uncharacterized protein n=1 Tax=Stentor coeruleus TaxID=5963 RepID=A0A1R2BGN5_9CILI|nr:hypothetical protein SteCoe_24851 [Stentor coeruleus]